MVRWRSKRAGDDQGFSDGLHRRLTPDISRIEDRRACRGGTLMLWLNSRAARLAVGFMLCAAPAMAQTQATINKLNEAWCAAFNKGDAAALAAMYADDATVLPQGGPMIKGAT